jgi:peptide/nickel transport system permease protein
MMRRLLAGVAVAWLGTVTLAAILAPVLAVHDPIQPIAAPLSPPAPSVLLGTDALGRDLLARMLFGARFSLVSGILATTFAAFVGGTAGLVAAMRSGWVERAILWASNALLSIPGLLLALMFLAALGPGLATIALSVGLGGAPGFARLSRSAFLTARRSDYVRASLALGAGSRWVALRHVMPNARTELLSLITTQFAWAFLGTTTLTFLGLAGDLSLPEWGAMLNDGRSHLVDAPHLALWPGVAIALTILSVQYLGSWFSRRPEPPGPMRQALPDDG